MLTGTYYVSNIDFCPTKGSKQVSGWLQTMGWVLCWVSPGLWAIRGGFLMDRSVQFSSVQLFSHVWLFATPWIAARQISTSITNSWSLLKLVSIVSVMPFNHLILCRHLLLLAIFPSIRIFCNESGSQSIGISPSVSVLPMNIQEWLPLGLTGWISLQSKGLSRVFSNTTGQKH